MVGSDAGVFGGLFVFVVGLTAVWAWRRRGRDARWPGLTPTLRAFVSVGLVTLVVIQAVPYGRDHGRPPVVAEPAWDSPETRALAVRACFDCHSNETEYPWYTNVAPISWALALHIDEGRQKLNFSEWDRPQREAERAAGTVRGGSMPLWSYELLHSAARLNATEKQALIDGLAATLGDRG